MSDMRQDILAQSELFQDKINKNQEENLKQFYDLRKYSYENEKRIEKVQAGLSSCDDRLEKCSEA